MFADLGFEFRRIFTVRVWVITLIVFIMAAIFFVYSGTVEYKNFQAEKQSFIEFERNNVSKYVNYDQYGGYGFRVLYEPPVISIFFNNSDIFDNLYSNIDMTEIIKIYSSYKGRDLFLKKGIFKDMAGLFFIFGSLLMIFMGLTAYKHEKHFFNSKNVLLRMAIIDAVFIVLLLLLYGVPGIVGLKIDNPIQFFLFCLLLILFLNFFYAAGLFIKILLKNKLLAVILCFVFWFFSTIIITEINTLLINKKSQALPHNEKYNLEKLDEVMNFERHCEKTFVEKGVNNNISEKRVLQRGLIKDFLKNGHMRNKKRENEIYKGVERLIGEYEKYSTFYPTLFYTYISAENSGKGFSGYLDFSRYIFGMKGEFENYYIQKKFYSDDKTVENFVKNEENIFKAKPYIRKTFWSGSLLTAVYTAILFLTAYLIRMRRLKKKKETFKPEIEMEEGDMVYLRCQDKEYMDKIYNHYEEQDNTFCIDNIKGNEIDPGIGLYQTALYFCHFLGARVDRTFEHIEQLGIKDLKKEPYKPEAVKKIFCAAAMAVEKDIIVFREFIHQESRDFERKFLALLKDTMEMDRTIIYLGVEPLLISSSYTDDLKVDKFKAYPIDDPTNFILR